MRCEPAVTIGNVTVTISQCPSGSSSFRHIGGCRFGCRRVRSLHDVTIVAVLLAAGAGTRFTGSTHKLLAPLDGRSVIERSVTNVVQAGIGPLVVVTGSTHLVVPADVTVCHNPEWARGQATSLIVAVREAEDRGADFLVIGLADQPGIVADTWRAIAHAPHEHPIVVASYDGYRGPHPVRLHRSLWPELPITGDDGARTLLRDHPELVHEVACGGSAFDIDTLEDAQRWKSS
jgi:molybdenum cofactor cytidylyltransferase